MMSLGTTFQKNSFHPGENKDLDIFFSNSTPLQTLSKVFLASQSLLTIYNASSKILPSTPKRLLKTQTLEEKGYLSN